MQGGGHDDQSGVKGYQNNQGVKLEPEADHVHGGGGGVDQD